MTEKEWKIIGEEFISYTGGYAYLISNGDCRFCVWERKEDVQKVCDRLNELAEENNDLKKENKKLKCINKQVEDRLENSGIGIALDMGD